MMSDDKKEEVIKYLKTKMEKRQKMEAQNIFEIDQFKKNP